MNIKNKILKLITAFFIGSAVAFGFLKHRKEENRDKMVSEEKKD
jgi:hypothetical protein